MYLVVSGKVALSVKIGNQKEVLQELERNDFFNLVSFMDGQTTWHGAAAIEDCEVLQIQKTLV